MKDRRESDEHEASPLWPSAAESSSGLRPRRDDLELLGSSASPYQLLEAVGSSSYGRAFRARHSEQGREVGLHLLEVEDDGEGTFAGALPLAVAKCAQLSHPNVIALETHGRVGESGPIYLITEPLVGVSLADLLEEEGVFALPRALALALQIGRALRAAHKLGIVHGALSPANVRLLASEHGELARVVGFGSAMFMGPVRDTRPAARVHDSYLAPECRDGGAPGPYSDVYAMGALLYRMLTGRPFAAREPVPQMLLSQFSREPIPRDLDELVMECLEPDVGKRMGDVVSMMRRLREIARVQNASLQPSDERIALSASSLPPPELPPAEGESSGSLFGGDPAARRGGVLWIALSLLVALAAVWLLWDASVRMHHPEPPAAREAGAR